MRVLRYDVPVDGKSHEIVCAVPLHVDCRNHAVVTFWALDGLPGELAARPRTFRVWGTGHAVPDEWHYCGTALTPEPLRGALVWHLFEFKRVMP